MKLTKRCLKIIDYTALATAWVGTFLVVAFLIVELIAFPILFAVAEFLGRIEERLESLPRLFQNIAIIWFLLVTASAWGWCLVRGKSLS
jgi:hypothetical protein